MRAMMILILALTLASVGCGSVTRVVVMQNPGTGQVVECKVDPWGGERRDKQIEDCRRAYEGAGFRVVGDRNK